MKSLSSHSVHVLFQTANSPRWVVDITKGLVLAWALVLAPASVTAQVTDATRAKIVELQASDPGFKLKTFHRGCLDGSIQDAANCEAGLTDHIYIHRKKAEVNAIEARVKAKEAELEIASKVLFDLNILLSLIYTANYIELNLPFPDWWEIIGKVLNSPDTPKDIIALLTTFKLRKDRWEKFDYNSDGKMILATMTRYIDAVTMWLWKLENTKYYQTFQSSLKYAQSGFWEAQRAFSRKSS